MHVATSQMSSLFDIKFPRNETHVNWLPFKLINVFDKLSPHLNIIDLIIVFVAIKLQQWISICKRLGDTNLVTLGLSVFGIALLLVVKEVVEPRLKKKFKLNVPIPIDIMLVIGFTVFSHFMKLHDRNNVNIMGDIPRG